MNLSDDFKFVNSFIRKSNIKHTAEKCVIPKRLPFCERPDKNVNIIVSKFPVIFTAH